MNVGELPPPTCDFEDFVCEIPQSGKGGKGKSNGSKGSKGMKGSKGKGYGGTTSGTLICYTRNRPGYEPELIKACGDPVSTPNYEKGDVFIGFGPDCTSCPEECPACDGFPVVRQIERKGIGSSYASRACGRQQCGGTRG